VGDQHEIGQLAKTDLVEDLARLLLLDLVDLLPLPARQVAQGSPRQVGVQPQRLDRGDQAVAAEGHGVPGDAGGGEGAAGKVVAEDADVLPAAPEEPVVERLVVGVDLGAGLVPGPVGLLQAGERAVELEAERRLFVVQQRKYVDLQDERLVGRQLERKDGLAVAVPGLGVVAVEEDLGRPPDAVLAHVAEAKPDLAALDRVLDAHRVAAVVAADSEDVAEVGVEVQLQVHLDREAVAVLHADPLVEAAVEEAGAAEADGLPVDVLVTIHLEGRVDELEGRHVGAIDAAAEQDRRGAVEGELEAGQEAGVEVVEPEPVVVADGHVAGCVGDREHAVLLENDPVFKH
jgi:hypothetical protein